MMQVEKIKRVYNTATSHCQTCAELGWTESSSWPLYRIPLSDGTWWHLCDRHLKDLYIAVGHHVKRESNCLDETERLRAEMVESQAVTLLAITVSEKADATITQLRSALAESCDIAMSAVDCIEANGIEANGESDLADNIEVNRTRVAELRRLVRP